MTNWVEWAALALGAFSAIGVAYLIFQTLYDVLPSLSYKLDLGEVLASRRGLASDSVRAIGLNFSVWNRTSRDAKMQCGLAVPISREPSGSSYWMLLNLGMVNAQSLVAVSMREFTIPANTGHRFFLQGEVLAGKPDPTVLEFSIQDDRIGRRRWKRTRDLPVGRFPEPISP